MSSIVVFRDNHANPLHDPVIRVYENMDEVRNVYPDLRKSGPCYALTISDLSDPAVRKFVPNMGQLARKLHRFGVKVPQLDKGKGMNLSRHSPARVA